MTITQIKKVDNATDLIEGSSQHRLNQVIVQLKESTGESKTNLGRRLGYSSSHWSMILNGFRPITERLLISLEAIYGINPEYIRDGSEPVHIERTNTENTEPRSRLNHILSEMNESMVKRVLDYVENLNPGNS